MQKFILLFLLKTVNLISPDAGYCGISRNHTMCAYPNRPSKLCMFYEPHPLNIEDIATILNEHNRIRNLVALGKENRGLNGKQPPAANMMEIVWDKELASIAQRWALQCDIHNHDACRNVERFKVGQSMAAAGASGIFDSDLIELIEKWYEEVQVFNPKLISFYKPSPVDPLTAYSHYTQLVWANTEYIGMYHIKAHNARCAGCARTVFQKREEYLETEMWTMEFIVCNYGPKGNNEGEPVYVVGQACSKCPKNTFPSTLYPGLCERNREDLEKRNFQITCKNINCHVYNRQMLHKRNSFTVL